ncbi:hypothetical protein D9619_003876 [Psilocybe cf. subviscida]|uniref:Uncharacterized protein n=1 Tax=Psilocybe cf. subviscida TaxID=2480587 RepID=A0A8H5F8S7_9AGAR|nr:hypothetical protein D9619_003876 [Psilocybe cf. subviscida]
MSMVSPFFRDEAQRQLFRNPQYQYMDVHKRAPSANTAALFLHQIISSPTRLAAMVRGYKITVSWHDTRRIESEARERQSTSFARLRAALPLMVNLKELQYHTNSDSLAPPAPICSILLQCTFELDVFCFVFVGTEDRALLPELLKCQHYLHELWISEKRLNNTRESPADLLPPELVHSLCPMLEHLGGDTKVVATMMQGRKNIRYLSWDADLEHHFCAFGHAGLLSRPNVDEGGSIRA